MSQDLIKSCTSSSIPYSYTGMIHNEDTMMKALSNSGTSNGNRRERLRTNEGDGIVAMCLLHVWQSTTGRFSRKRTDVKLLQLLLCCQQEATIL